MSAKDQTATRRKGEVDESLRTAVARIADAVKGPAGTSAPRAASEDEADRKLAERVAGLRGELDGLIAERTVLEHRVATLERAMTERWVELPETPPPAVANEERMFVRVRRTIPLSIRKTIVETYRRWSR